MAVGTLYLVGTPIGNLGDMSARGLETLRAAHVVAAEDTRHSRQLLTHFGIQTGLVSYHAHNAVGRGDALVERLLAGEDVALVSDAGMPGISDPGEALVAAAAAAGVPVVPIPGPTAFVAALVASGLPTGRFAFEGFLSREPKRRRRTLRELAAEPRTLVFYEAPHRLAEALADMADAWGAGRAAAVARELTKKHEEVRRGTLGELAAHFAAVEPRGEIVVVVGPPTEPVEKEVGDWRTALAEALAAGQAPTDAARAVARAFGVPRREVYAAAVEGRG